MSGYNLGLIIIAYMKVVYLNACNVQVKLIFILMPTSACWSASQVLIQFFQPRLPCVYPSLGASHSSQ